MRKFILSLMIGLSLLCFGKDKETVDDLKAKVATAEKPKQAEIYTEIAKLQLKAADDTYSTNPEAARALFEDSVQAAEKAATASIEAGKRLKQVEIDLRKLSHHVEEIRQSWAFDDRPPLDAGVQRIDAARTKLLDRMFKK
jgi:hypothetical protein